MLKFVNSFFQANYQDILPLVVDGRKFLIDGDSLLMLALDSKGLSSEIGGTSLHIIYIVEKFLSTFHAKGLNFVLVFFKASVTALKILCDTYWHYRVCSYTF